LDPYVKLSNKWTLEIVKAEPMVGMKDDGYARQFRSPTSEDPRLRTVGMYDLGPFASEEKPEPNQCAQVFERPHLTNHRRNPDSHQIGNSICPVNQKTFRSGNQSKFIAVAGKALEHHQCCLLRAAKLQLGNDVENFGFHRCGLYVCCQPWLCRTNAT